MPWKPAAPSDLQRQVDTLAMRLLKANSELHLKTQYAQRLEYLLHERSERIDELTGRIDQLRERNKRLEAEAEHLAKIAADRPADYPTHLGNILRDALERARKLKFGH